MPNQPEPPNNLGLVYEAAGKLDEVADAYGKAVLEPDNVEALGNLVRAKVRRGDRDPSVRALLNKLVLRDTRPEWLAWEKRFLVRLESPGRRARPRGASRRAVAKYAPRAGLSGALVSRNQGTRKTTVD